MRRSRVLVVVCLAVGLLAALWTPAQAVKKGSHFLDDLVMESGAVHVQPLLASADALRAEGLAARPESEAFFEAWDRFLSENGLGWTATVDRRTGTLALAEGQGLPWVPGAGNSLRKADIRAYLGASGKVNERTLLRRASEFLAANQPLFGASPEEFDLTPAHVFQPEDYLWFLTLPRRFAGIPVEKSYVVFRVNHGNLIQFGGEFLGPISIDPKPYVTVETAREILAGYIGGFEDGDVWVNDGSLSFLPVAGGDASESLGSGLAWRLVYTLAFRREGVLGTWEAKVDAHTGEIVLFRDANEYGSVTGGIYPNSYLDTEVIRPLPWITVTNSTTKYTDLGGNYSYAGGTASCALTGKYVKVVDSCGSSSLSTTTSPGDLAFSKSSGTDCTTPGVGGSGNTHAARSTYYHLTHWKVKAQAWLPSNTWLTGQLTDNVNLNQTCNAYWNGSSVNFFKSGGGCANTGELPTVFLHEVGHGLDSNDGGPSSDMGTGETYGDTNGFLMTHDSCVGTGFFTDGSKCSGYGDACTSCTGIRDVDYAKHASATPHTPLNFTKVKCPTSTNYKGPCGREGHCESYPLSEALWDLAARDLVSAGYSAATAWQIVERLFFLSRSTSGSGFTCNTSTFASDGCGTSNWYKTFLAVDDDNGNLNDGTPHMQAIYNAFNRHAVACSTPTVQNSSTCPSIGQPTLTATAGTGQVALSWGAVTNASKYLVLRNERSSTAGFTIIAQPTGTSYTDTAVAGGVTYYYSVQAVGSTSACFGALAAVKSATPTSGTPTTYSISGTVTLNGSGLSGVTVSTGSASATTNTSGNYTISGLANGTYTVTPSKTGYTFSPANYSVTINGANVTGKNFTATATGGGDTVLTSGVAVNGSVAYQAYVQYDIAVPSGATQLKVELYNLTADVDLYTGSPTLGNPTTSSYTGRSWNSGTTSELITHTNPAAGTWNIAAYGYAAGSYTVRATVTTATATYSISGTVTLNGSGLSGVTVSTGSASATTNTSGNYTISGLANGTYTVTPSKTGYTFSPANYSVTINGANVTGKNFTATASGGSTTLFSNGFESSTGWAQRDTSGTAGYWRRVTSGTYPTCSRHGGSYMAKFNSYSASSGSATRYYRTSGFAISSSYTTVTLTFWMYHDTGYSSYADKIQPQVSTNGSTWVNVGSAINRYDGSTGWKQHTVNISTYKGQTVYLGFLATSAYGNNMYIDDVVVTAQ